MWLEIEDSFANWFMVGNVWCFILAIKPKALNIMHLNIMNMNNKKGA
jgi:hypothetical protein